MEIKNVLSGLNAYDRTKLNKAESEQLKSRQSSGKAEGATGDRVEFSDEAKLRTEAYSTASNTSDIRRDKVEEIKARIAAGEYQMDSRKIAQNLVRDELDLNI